MKSIKLFEKIIKNGFSKSDLYAELNKWLDSDELLAFERHFCKMNNISQARLEDVSNATLWDEAVFYFDEDTLVKFANDFIRLYF